MGPNSVKSLTRFSAPCTPFVIRCTLFTYVGGVISSRMATIVGILGKANSIIDRRYIGHRRNDGFVLLRVGSRYRKNIAIIKCIIVSDGVVYNDEIV